jgi:hypothetical protein
MRTVVTSENLKTLFRHIEIATMLPLQSATGPKRVIVECEEAGEVAALVRCRAAGGLTGKDVGGSAPNASGAVLYSNCVGFRVRLYLATFK